jgi:hypothetical protein
MRPARDYYFFSVDPGVVLASSGAEGLRRPRLFSGVPELTFVFPGPAVPGLSPRGPDGVTAASFSDCSESFALACCRFGRLEAMGSSFFLSTLRTWNREVALPSLRKQLLGMQVREEGVHFARWYAACTIIQDAPESGFVVLLESFGVCTLKRVCTCPRRR